MCGDALRLGSKGKYGSFLLWMKVWVACKTVWSLVSTCHTVPERFRDEFLMIKIYYYTVSQKTSHLCFAITLTSVNGFWYFFCRNVTDKVSSKRHLITPPQITCASVLPGKTGNTKITFFPRCISAFPEFNQLLLDFFIFFWLTTHTHAALWLPKSCNQCVQLGAFVKHGSGERKSRALQQLDCVACIKHQYAVFWVSSFTR